MFWELATCFSNRHTFVSIDSVRGADDRLRHMSFGGISMTAIGQKITCFKPPLPANATSPLSRTPADMQGSPAIHIHKENTMKTHKGFSLIELMIVVAIVGILAVIAVPSYQSYVVKGNRAAAQAFMADVANREKQYLLDARVYLAVANNADFQSVNPGLGMTVPTDVSKHYVLSVTLPTATPPTFTVTATPNAGGQQSGDGWLSLTDDGTKSSQFSGKW